VADTAREIFAIEEIGGWSLVQFAGWHGTMAALEQAVTAKCGIEAPRKVGGVNRRGSSALIRVAPDRFWLIDDAGMGSPGVDGGSSFVSTTPLTEGRRRLRLTGMYCRKILAKCVAIDWDIRGPTTDYAIQTMLHRVPILLHRFGEDGFDLFVPRSFKQSLEEWIADAALEFSAAKGSGFGR
jgi:heterotetrameric sarcosine oxidase gamma subunit